MYDLYIFGNGIPRNLEVSEAVPSKFGLNRADISVRYDRKALLLNMLRIKASVGKKLLGKANAYRFSAFGSHCKNGVSGGVLATVIYGSVFTSFNYLDGKLADERIRGAI